MNNIKTFEQYSLNMEHSIDEGLLKDLYRNTVNTYNDYKKDKEKQSYDDTIQNNILPNHNKRDYYNHLLKTNKKQADKYVRFYMGGGKFPKWDDAINDYKEGGIKTQKGHVFGGGA